jgi:hypothetical protein
MNKIKPFPTRTFAIQITCRGFGYLILEDSMRPVDWGTKQTTRPGEAKTIEVVASLVAQYRPHYVLLEDVLNESHRRSPRAVLVTRRIAEFLAERGVNCALVPAAMVKNTFQRWSAHTKQDRAHIVSELLPDLAQHLPPPRKPWMSEDSRMSIFSAAAIALTFLDNQHRLTVPESLPGPHVP